MHADAALPILAEMVVGDLLVVLDGLRLCQSSCLPNLFLGRCDGWRQACSCCLGEVECDGDGDGDDDSDNIVCECWL